MKVIDLLNKIAKGEIERGYKFEYRNKIVTIHFLIDNYLFLEILNDEIEFIKDDIEEEKKIPEKLDFTFEDKFIIEHFKSGAINYLSTIGAIKQLYDKQCEIIDYLKSKGE